VSFHHSERRLPVGIMLAIDGVDRTPTALLGRIRGGEVVR
jgi:hypothetical protein